MKLWPFGKLETRNESVYSDSVIAELWREQPGQHSPSHRLPQPWNRALASWGAGFANAEVHGRGIPCGSTDTGLFGVGGTFLDTSW